MEQTADAKPYYGYLFEANKKPTKVLDALLRGIANYIIECIGDKDVRVLSPAKLAAFYKAVGGNYDPLFVDVPHPSISYIYQSIGCQHVLHYTGNDFAAPSIPTLTPRGFVRWESIEILLNPEEHVPYLQTALRNFPIKHPDTGVPFPTDLPAGAFPLKTDPEIERWHKACAEKLRRRASPDGYDHADVKPSLPPRHKLRTGYSYLKNPTSARASPGERQQGADYFSSRPLRYKYVPSGDTAKPPNNRGSSYRPYLSPNDGPTQPHRLRRRSFPDNVYSPPLSESQSPISPKPTGDQPRSEDHTRRHSHPRHRRDCSSSSSSCSGSDAEPESSEASASPTSAPSRKSQPRAKNPTANIRVSVPSPGSPMTPSYPYSPQRHHNLAVPNSRDRTAPYKIPIDGSGKVSPAFTPGVRYVPIPEGNGRGGNGRWDLASEIPTQKRRASLNMAATVEDDIDNDEDDGRRERDRKRRGDGTQRLTHERSGSHDGRYSPRDSDRDRRDSYRERYSDRDEKDLDRRRDRNSPPKADVPGWRKYIPEILR